MIVSQSKPILVVDDDEAILDIVEMTLDEEGYHVTRAQDGSEALRALESLDPDLILLDMRMPVMNGWEFAETYRQRFHHRSPIVVMTAGQDAAEKCAEIQADGCLAKPFDLAELIVTVKRYARNGYS